MPELTEPDGVPAQPRTLNDARRQLHQPLRAFVKRRATAMHGRVQLTSRNADHLVGQVFTAARMTGWSSLHQPRLWLYVVARHQLQLLAARQRAERQNVIWSPGRVGRRPAEVGYAAIVSAQAACAQPPEHQATYLRFCERWTIGEIAAALGISEADAYTRTDGALLNPVPRAAPGPHPADLARRRADLTTMITTLTAGGVCAATGVLLAGIWQTVLGVAGVMLALASITLGVRYLWTEHLWARWADHRRARTHAAELSASPPARVLLLLIRCYQREISPRLAPRCCRFTPTCSTYAQQALNRYGALRGSYLTARRIARCRPSTPRSNDPLPPRQLPTHL